MQQTIYSCYMLLVNLKSLNVLTRKVRTMSNQLQKGCLINCKCGKSGLTLVDGKAKLKVQCGCTDCRQALEYGFVNGGVKPDPLPELYYMVSDITDVRGKDFMKAFRLREDDPSGVGMSTRIYCTQCYSILGVDHPVYQSNVFLNYPFHLLMMQ